LNKRTAAIIPAYNEEAALSFLLDELTVYIAPVDVIVINDGSTDATSAVARSKGAIVLDLPCNIGVGGAVQTGFKYAFDRGYEYVIRIDGDGQHPPSEIPELMDEMKKGTADLVIGSRFIGGSSYVNTHIRSIGIKSLAVLLSIICRSRITDPTSGFWMINRQLLYYFSNDYPTEYPEPEAVALLRRHGFSYKEKSVRFRPRTTGQSTIKKMGYVLLYF